MMTNDNMRELLEDGSIGLDLSPGNDLYKKAHDEILALRADLKRQQTVVEAAQRYTKLYEDAELRPASANWGHVAGAVENIRREVKALAVGDGD